MTPAEIEKLKAYIIAAQEQGLDELKISDELLRVGWSKRQLRYAFKNLTPRLSAKTVSLTSTVTPAKALIETRDLCKVYETGGVQTVALRNVNLSINKGEFIAIMGPSGSGKSTLLQLLGCLDRPSSGEYFFSGLNTEQLSPNALARLRNESLGFVFQAFNLLPRATVLENVKLPLMYSKTPKSIWDELATTALQSVQLSHRLNHTANQLSGGEKQRVAIARSIVNNPAVIFADEPTGNLDSVSGQTVMETLNDLHAKGRTIIVITHDAWTASQAKRTIRIKDGQIASDSRDSL